MEYTLWFNVYSGPVFRQFCYNVQLRDKDNALIDGTNELTDAICPTAAAYLGFIAGIQLALKHKVHRLVCKSRQELLIKQMTGVFKVKSPRLIELNIQAKFLTCQIPNISFIYLPKFRKNFKKFK